MQTARERAIMASIRARGKSAYRSTRRFLRKEQTPLEAAAIGAAAPIALRVLRHPLMRVAKGFGVLVASRWAAQQPLKLAHWASRRHAISQAARMYRKGKPVGFGLYEHRGYLFGIPESDVIRRALRPGVIQRGRTLVRRMGRPR